MDLFDKCRSFTTAREAVDRGIYPYFAPFQNSEGAVAVLDSREVVMCGSNNYLGLTTDRRLLDASLAALSDSGTSCTGSRLLNGNLALHEELEAELAAIYGKPAALVFPTGYHANVGSISALLSRADTVFVDREAHASAIDGCLMSRATVKFFGHNDADDLRARLARSAPTRGSLVIVDGVYSMSGDLVDLPEIVAVCQEFGVRLLVDDAHGAGVLGRGHGSVAQWGLTDQVDLITITFSKALASLGGAVIGDAEVIHYLRHHARTQIFSAGMTPASTAAALTAARISVAEPELGQRALDNARWMTARLRDLGFDAGESDSPIVPIHLPDTETTALLWRRLLDLGVYTNAVLPPAAEPRLRTSFMASHRPEQLDRVVSAFATVRDEYDVLLRAAA